MLETKVFRSKGLSLGLVGAFLLLFLPLEGMIQAPPATGSLVGFIYGENMEAPRANAVVKVRNVVSGKEFMSAPSDANGLYKIEKIEEGRYILGVISENKDFNFGYEMMLKANEMAKLSLSLKPGSAGSGGPAQQKPAGKGGFFSKWYGIAAIVAAAGIIVYGTYKLFIEEEEKSPSKK
ncbi:MAG TPA: hypothetical protein DIW61_13070 [Candidatus Aminicenantes bacterium]|nr:hypothetical protein [Candidatus Aminicenantes bacterium]